MIPRDTLTNSLTPAIKVKTKTDKEYDKRRRRRTTVGADARTVQQPHDAGLWFLSTCRFFLFADCCSFSFCALRHCASSLMLRQSGCCHCRRSCRLLLLLAGSMSDLRPALCSIPSLRKDRAKQSNRRVRLTENGRCVCVSLFSLLLPHASPRTLPETAGKSRSEQRISSNFSRNTHSRPSLIIPLVVVQLRLRELTGGNRQPFPKHRRKSGRICSVGRSLKQSVRQPASASASHCFITHLS